MAEYLEYKNNAWQLTDQQKKFFEAMEKELSTSITVIAGHSQRKERSADIEGIVFFDYSTNLEPPTPRKVDAISRRNHTTVKLENGFLLKADEGREHIFDFNGFPLCEIRLGTIWGLTPLQNFGTEALMKEFWADALRMSLDEKFFKDKEDQKRQKVRKAFLDAMKAANHTDVIAQETEIKTQSKTLGDLNEQLVQATANLLRAGKRLELAKRLAEGDEKAYEEEIGSLLKHKNLKRIDYNQESGVLEIYTNLLYIYSPNRRERAPLGEFLVKVDTRRNNTVTLHNLTNKKSHKMHPHVEENGQPCWGPISSQIASLAASCKIEGLTDLCVRYLESYNVEDGNAPYARYWFTAEATERLRSDFDQWMNDKTYNAVLKEKEKETVKAGKDKETVADKKADKVVTNKELQEA